MYYQEIFTGQIGSKRALDPAQELLSILPVDRDTSGQTDIEFGQAGTQTRDIHVAGTTTVEFSVVGAEILDASRDGTSGATFSHTGAVAKSLGAAAISPIQFGGIGHGTILLPPHEVGVSGIQFASVGAVIRIASVAGQSDVDFSGAGSVSVPLLGTTAVEFSGVGGVTFDLAGQTDIELAGSSPGNVDKLLAGTTDIEFDGIGVAGIPGVAGESGVEISQAGTVTKIVGLSGTSGVTFISTGDTLPIEGCETDFVPTPAIPVDPDSILYVWIWGPWDTLATQIRLKRPEIQDVRASAYQVTTRHTRGNERRVWRRTPTYRRFRLTFRDMSRRKLLEVENFFDQTAGHEIRYLDHEGRTWRAVALTDTIRLQHRDRARGGAYSIDLEGQIVG